MTALIPFRTQRATKPIWWRLSKTLHNPLPWPQTLDLHLLLAKIEATPLFQTPPLKVYNLSSTTKKPTNMPVCSKTVLHLILKHEFLGNLTQTIKWRPCLGKSYKLSVWFLLHSGDDNFCRFNRTNFEFNNILHVPTLRIFHPNLQLMEGNF